MHILCQFWRSSPTLLFLFLWNWPLKKFIYILFSIEFLRKEKRKREKFCIRFVEERPQSQNGGEFSWSCIHIPCIKYEQNHGNQPEFDILASFKFCVNAIWKNNLALLWNRCSFYWFSLSWDSSTNLLEWRLCEDK